MTPAQEAAIWRKPPPQQDGRPWWVRLLASLRVAVKPGKTRKRLIEEATIRGRVEW
jgi:hypothetical protein